ncbi:tRNA synthetase class II core domain (G, H, P, S and T) [Streptomyces sp. TLI_053]|uniref:aminoacyl--tRNA ligase-related protein n=1 Tax=Streptomyces sp. TLI_053 TaxID=1855352 RepID=UPI00087AA2C3|nr:aminoacyl--tRNA ligase-related protein [Streptomyces sp. TLI_053]SDT83345.1 tRNA synthetase class II core domain (G, H, P, S and T) [Streptomyces sp. TLI_053]
MTPVHDSLGLDTTALFASTGTPGIPLTLPLGHRLLAALRAGIAGLFADQVITLLQAPPVVPYDVVSRAGFAEAFPHLVGSVRLPDETTATRELTLTPAACHHAFSLLEGRLVTLPLCLGIEGTCFRDESRTETGRLRSFRMYELVFLGAPESVSNWLDEALRRAADWFAEIGLGHRQVLANDPFFGRTGALLGRLQREDRAKWELQMPVGPGLDQAVASFNHHRDHFGRAFSIRPGSGSELHSACAAFGLDRLLLAVVHAHGPDPGSWPAELATAVAT